MSRKKPTVLIDLSGTVHVDDAPIEGSVEAVQMLRDNGFTIRFLSNTTKHSSSTLIRSLRAMGLSIHLSELFTSLSAARDLVASWPGAKPMLFLEDDARAEFEAALGGSGTGAATEVAVGERKTDGSASAPAAQSDQPYSCVVVGLAPSMFEYENLTRAMNVLLAGGKLVAIHRGKYFARTTGLALGPGPFVSLLEPFASTPPTLVGKPNPAFFHLALASVPCAPEDAVMFGDDVRDDVQGAAAVGVRGFLVRTGKYRPGDEKEVGGVGRCWRDLKEGVEWLVREYGGN
ncbi:hypothetical protein M427DRAFT_30264 [Gonapodya prolifera JEL478]|uniref:STAS domain-containing protein n=1 Tax=Gonapodya prolifera (strain JEL478) TaxID=1344416 RepID=A0A139AM10_GONPJ|nr:hypothetical protein M427DRAFT_30264 [Gonapodya prolifera JEL478]|eukprot:KXS17810.1 hypothetical protein M427DRAFT_30264 [Gonapodya prolifera JEL478]